MVISNRFVVLDKYYIYSEFRSGIWKQGDFYDGIFGYERDISLYNQYSDWINRTFISSYWFDGKFHNGVFKNSVWYNGIFYDGRIENSYWLYGKFYDGTFYDYEWYNGLWYGGDFMKGNWRNGNFDQINNGIKSRFGTVDVTDSTTNWYGGTFYNGEFHSGLNIDSSGNTLPSIDSSKTLWWGGNFRGGNWFGGHFIAGYFYQGNWYGGVFGNQTGSTHYSDSLWYDGNWFNGLWINGTFYGGHFFDGMWLDGLFISGYISTNTVEGDLSPEPPPRSIFLPSVETHPATNILSNSAIGNGRVTNNGGGIILNRGICYSKINTFPVTGNTNDNYTISDGGGMGNISILINGLNYGTTYYYTAFAMNTTGLTYGIPSGFTTSSVPIGVPNVITLPIQLGFITSTTAFIEGNVTNSPGSSVSVYGFYYSSTNSEPNETDYIFVTDPPSPSIIGPNGEGYFNTTCAGLTVITGLTALTLYYVRAFAVNASGIGYGDPVRYFTTNTSSPPTTPTVTSDSVTDILDTSAVMNGTVVDSGNDPIIVVGACWSTSPNPTIADPHSEKPPQLTFDISMTGLIENTTYYAKAYATNGQGTGYGADIEFKTGSIPIVELLSVTPV
jgi:hypothetical protein